MFAELKGNSGVSTSWVLMKEYKTVIKNPKEQAITDLHVPNGSCDIAVQSHEFGHISSPQGCRHFLDFKFRSRLKENKCDVIAAPPETMEKLKCIIRISSSSICLEFYRFIEFVNRIQLALKMHNMTSKTRTIAFC